MFGRFQNISWNPTFACNHARDREYIFALFIDLSKVFDTINNDLLLAKLKACGFSMNAVKLMRNYLKNRKQQVQINNKFSAENIIIARVLQGSIDGPLLINLFINDLISFMQYCTLSNYVDDNNFYFLWVKTKMK